jgi:ankyrin repeat protein
LLLLDGAAEVNRGRSDTGVTPLYIASEKGYDTVVGLLLNMGGTPLHP